MKFSLLPRGMSASIVTMVVILIMGLSLVEATELRPGVVIDPETQTVFIAVPEGGIEAIDIQTGKVRWTSTDADMPVAVHNGRLITRIEAESPGRLILKSLDARNGSVLHVSEAALPADVHALIDERLGERFQVRTDVDETSLFVTWRYSYQLITGPKPEREEAPRISTGTFEYKLDSGEIFAEKAARLWPAAAIELVDASKRMHGVSGRQFRAASGKHVLASERQRGEPAGREYTWTVLSEKGDELGSFPADRSYSPFHVAGEVLAYVVFPSVEMTSEGPEYRPLSLRAVNTEDGAERWMMTFRDTTYFGPIPP